MMRGDLPEKAADELDADDLREANLILWGDPESNPMIAEIASKLPVVWKEDSFVLRGTAYPRDARVPGPNGDWKIKG